MSDKVIVEIGGDIVLEGLVVGQNEEVFVLFDGKDYLYIIRDHIRRLTHDTEVQEEIWPHISQVMESELNIDRLLQNARDFSLELVVMPDKALHGKVGRVLDDYFEFQTPLYKTLYIAKKHVKWLIPYEPQGALVAQHLQRPEPLLALQLERLKGEVVQINQGSESRIVAVNNGMIEVEYARGVRSFVNVRHVQFVWVDVRL